MRCFDCGAEFGPEDAIGIVAFCPECASKQKAIDRSALDAASAPPPSMRNIAPHDDGFQALADAFMQPILDKVADMVSHAFIFGSAGIEVRPDGEMRVVTAEETAAKEARPPTHPDASVRIPAPSSDPRLGAARWVP